MAGSSYNYDKNSSFFATEDDMDAAFLSGRRAYQSSTPNERFEQLLEERRKIEERTVQSSMRSVGLLKESEDLGNETAKELAHQREQLQNTEGKLDEINKTLRTSQRHIQGIKSVFGSIRNYFSGSKTDGVKMSTSTSDSDIDKKESSTKSQLSQILETRQEECSSIREHPSERFRSDSIPTSQQVDSILDRNLEDMGEIIGRLKGLGKELNKEIDSQNDMIDRIHMKTENTDHKIQVQTKDMNRILKK